MRWAIVKDLAKRRLRIVRDKVQPRPEVIHDANEYLKSDPLRGVGVRSSFPAFEEMMNAYYSGKRIKRVPFEKTLHWIAKELEENDPPSPPHRWRRAWRLPLGRLQRVHGVLGGADIRPCLPSDGLLWMPRILGLGRRRWRMALQHEPQRVAEARQACFCIKIRSGCCQ